MEFIYLTIGLVIGGVSTWYLVKLKLHSTSQALQTKLDGIQQNLQENKTELVQEREKNLHLSTNLARLAADNKNLAEKGKEQKQEVEKIQEKFTIQFKNLANDLLEEKSKKFTDQNKINLENILKPLGERIVAFEKKVEQTNKESLERNVALRTEIKKLNELNSQITKEAENLTKAIKGDIKVQGDWGEFILESSVSCDRSGETLSA